MLIVSDITPAIKFRHKRNLPLKGKASLASFNRKFVF